MHLELIYPAQAQEKKQLLPLFDTTSVRKIEAFALSQTRNAVESLMQRAGFSLFRLARAKYPHMQRIWVVAGAGNNGGDAIVAANFFHQAGFDVHVTWLGQLESASSDTAQSYKDAVEVGVEFIRADFPVTDFEYDLIIDGLLGIGLNPERELSETLHSLIQQINQCKASVLSVDLPSGLVSDTGGVLSACVQANVTLSFLTLKPGLLTHNGVQYAGEIWLDTLVRSISDASDDTLPVLQTMPEPPQPCAYFYTGAVCQKARDQNTHKGSFGDVVIIGGSTGMTGAAILASRAATAGGAGRVYTCLLGQGANSFNVDTQSPELMFRGFDAAKELIASTKTSKNTVVACGCGGGQEIADILPQLLMMAQSLILDADALNAIAQTPALQALLTSRNQRQMANIITPHPLEAARLLGSSAASVQSDRLAAAQTLADRYQTVCVLKGSGSVIAAPGCIPLVNSSGNASLATAGSGDVLTGYLAACWVAEQNQQGGGVTDAPESRYAWLQQITAQAVWQHGYVANRWCRAGRSGAISASHQIECLYL